MGKQGVDRQRALDVLQSLQHGLNHLKQSNLDEEGQHAMRPLVNAERKLKEAMLHDVVFASVAAEEDYPGHVVLGVTAHCRCGHCFAADVDAILHRIDPKSEGTH